MYNSSTYRWYRRDRDRMVVEFTTTYAISAVVSSNHDNGEVYSIQHYVIKFVSDLREVCVFSEHSSFLHQ